MWAAPLDAASSAQHMCKVIFFTWGCPQTKTRPIVKRKHFSLLVRLVLNS